MSELRWDASAFNAHLRAMEARADDATRQAVAEGAALIERKMKENSTGRPGPNVRTGAHRRGITTSAPIKLGPAWEARIGPTVVYSRRLELGGGNWPPGRKFPYAAPALDWARNGPIAAVFARAWAGVHR